MEAAAAHEDLLDRSADSDTSVGQLLNAWSGANECGGACDTSNATDGASDELRELSNFGDFDERDDIVGAGHGVGGHDGRQTTKSFHDGFDSSGNDLYQDIDLQMASVLHLMALLRRVFLGQWKRAFRSRWKFARMRHVGLDGGPCPDLSGRTQIAAQSTASL